MFIHTIQQTLINIQWADWMLYAFIKYIMSLLDQQTDKGR
jgi:hypothetical protein